MRRWGALAGIGARRTALLGASAVLALCLLLIGGAHPANAHQDRAHTAFSQTYDNATNCVECKCALLPSRALVSRDHDADVAVTPPAQSWSVSQTLGAPLPPAAGRAHVHVRATGVMRVGNVMLLN